MVVSGGPENPSLISTVNLQGLFCCRRKKAGQAYTTSPGKIISVGITVCLNRHLCLHPISQKVNPLLHIFMCTYLVEFLCFCLFVCFFFPFRRRNLLRERNSQFLGRRYIHGKNNVMHL